MVGGGEKNSEIIAIFNRYKNTLDDFIESSNLESPPKLIDKGSRNAPKSRGGLTGLLEKDYLDKDMLALNRSS